MSYDPTVGRWLEQDPAGYIDGPNMYQFEDSNPATLVDPSGLAATISEPGFNENSIIVDLPDDGHVALADGIEGTVSVYPDYDFDAVLKTKQGPQNKSYSRAIEIKLTAPKSCTKYKWLQFGRSVRLAGKTEVGGFVQIDIKKAIKYGETSVDSRDPASPFNNVGGVYDLTDTVSATLDAPDVRISPADKALGVTEEIFYGDDFLVSDPGGQVYYHVHWERVGYADGTSEYTNVGGEPISKLPAWASTPTLPQGYDPDSLKPLQPYTNPVAPQFRQ